MSEAPAMDHTPVESYATRGLRLWAEGQYPHGRSHAGCLTCADTHKYLNLPALAPAPVSVPLREERAS